jgi:hypothetical protein
MYHVAEPDTIKAAEFEKLDLGSNRFGTESYNYLDTGMSRGVDESYRSKNSSWPE